MSWYTLSRRTHILSYGLKQVADSQVQRNICQRIELTSYDIQRRCGFTSWPITRRCQVSPCSFNQVERYRSVYESRRHYASYVTQEKKSRKIIMYLSALALGMAGCSYVAAPLYGSFCQVTGFNVQHHETVQEEISEHSDAATREVVIQFNTDVADDMPWKFVPSQSEVRVKPGESASSIYAVENQSSSPVVVVFTYKITPMKAAEYFRCVCLEEQKLLPGEHVDMPVFFYIDPKFVTDPRMDGIENLTVSCTFTKIS